MTTILGEIINQKNIDRSRFDDLRNNGGSLKKPVQDVMIDAGLLDEDEFFRIASKVFKGPVINQEEEIIDPSCIDLIPYSLAQRYGVFPVRKEKKGLLLAMSNPHDLVALNDIGFIVDTPLNPALCTQKQMAGFIKEYYVKGQSIQTLLKNAEKDVDDDDGGEDRTSDDREEKDISEPDELECDLLKFINRLISDAVDARSSDVHIEPQEDIVNVRYRIDGHLKSVVHIPKRLLDRIITRFKILAKLDIAEKRAFQDGRISIWMDGRKIDLRVSIVPVYYGEKAVLRILDRENAMLDFDKIGFQPEEKKIFHRAITRPQGVVLMTGPTGSGKTTTIYSALQHINDESRNIVTVEDPVEYLIEGVNQLQLNRIKDITFANCLRSILRQDPDILFVGEIRDQETAEVAFQASLTGHLVFTSLHTNNSASSIVRLMDIGLEPYLIASSINVIVSQRLVRVICPDCKEAYRPAQWLRDKFMVHLDEAFVSKFVKGKGCDCCNFTGYKGRTSIFELLEVTPKIKSLIYNRASEGSIFNQALKDGMKTLAQSGIAKVKAGLTTLEEVASVTDVVQREKEEEISIADLMQEKYLSTIKG